MAKKKKRAMAALKTSTIARIGSFLIRVRGISLNIANNSTVFVTPSPTVTVVDGHIADLQTAQDLVQTRVLGATTGRDIAYNIVFDDIFAWQGMVQKLADAAPNFEAAVNIITLSGFDVKVNGVFIKPDLAVKEAGPGTLKLIAKSLGRKVSYEWQMSTNNGTTWTNLPNTLVAKTLVTGLNPGTRYWFRVRGTLTGSITLFTAPVSIVVQFP